MTEMLWRKIEWPDQPVHLDMSDTCYYAREYQSRGGFRASDTNNLISNFKKSPEHKNTNQWYWKEKAISRCASELALLFPADSPFTLAAIPTSKREDDIDYDSRLDDTLRELKQLRPNVIIEKPIAFEESHEPQHHATDRMSPDDVYDLLEWRGFSCDFVGTVILFDDVITCGSHFKACQRLISENCQDVGTNGVFWARTVWHNRDEPVAP